MLVKHGYAIRIGREPQDSPYFMLSEDRKGVQIFDKRGEALAKKPKETRCAVVRVKIVEQGGA